MSNPDVKDEAGDRATLIDSVAAFSKYLRRAAEENGAYINYERCIVRADDLDTILAALSDGAKDKRIAEAWAANERDRSRVADALNAITDEVARRSWLCSSRGSYEWDDERYQQEFSQALDAIGAATDKLKAVAGDWSHSPMSDDAIQIARIDWKARAEAAEAQLRLTGTEDAGVRALVEAANAYLLAVRRLGECEPGAKVSYFEELPMSEEGVQRWHTLNDTGVVLSRAVAAIERTNPEDLIWRP